MKICKNYVGLSCIDGTCPIANADEYEERGMDVVKKCSDCYRYKGCEDCASYDPKYCDSPIKTN